MKLAILAATALALVAAPAFAQSTSASAAIGVSGSVAPQCGTGNQSGGGVAGGVPITLGELTGATGQLTGAAVPINFGNVWCNKGANLSMTATALTTTTANTDTGSFTNTLDMIIDNGGNARSVFVYFGGATSVRTGAPATNTVPNAFETGTGDFSTGSLRVVLPASTAGNDRPVAGTYTGTVTFTATAS